jgi:hypothetical protein
MRDNFTGDNVDVRVSDKCGAYIMIEPARIGPVEELLRKNAIPFTLDDGTNPRMGTPEAALIVFGRDADLEKIPRGVDSA